MFSCVFSRFSAAANSVNSPDISNLPRETFGTIFSVKPVETAEIKETLRDKVPCASDYSKNKVDTEEVKSQLKGVNICQPSETERVDRVNSSKRPVSEPRESLIKTNSQQDRIPMSVKDTRETIKEEIKLLPPAAFLLKKGGSPILDGSGVLPNDFRIDSKLEHGQATLKDNHDMPTSVHTRAALQVPDNFRTVSERQSETLSVQQKPTHDQYQFVSPAEEIVYIRNVLRDFKQLKHKHR